MNFELSEFIITAAELLAVIYIILIMHYLLARLNGWLRKRLENGEKDRQNTTIK